jgi:hemerythrin
MAAPGRRGADTRSLPEVIPMVWFDWNDNFVTGTGDIDEQHRRLVTLIDEFYDALGKTEPDKGIGRLLRGLLDYTQYHFSTEERYMRLYAYPLREMHVAQHNAFVEKIQDIDRRFSNGELVLSFAITGYLREWLTKHILVVDKELGRFLASRQAH